MSYIIIVCLVIINLFLCKKNKSKCLKCKEDCELRLK